MPGMIADQLYFGGRPLRPFAGRLRIVSPLCCEYFHDELTAFFFGRRPRRSVAVTARRMRAANSSAVCECVRVTSSNAPIFSIVVSPVRFWPAQPPSTPELRGTPRLDSRGSSRFHTRGSAAAIPRLPCAGGGYHEAAHGGRQRTLP